MKFLQLSHIKCIYRVTQTKTKGKIKSKPSTRTQGMLAARNQERREGLALASKQVRSPRDAHAELKTRSERGRRPRATLPHASPENALYCTVRGGAVAKNQTCDHRF